MKELDELRINIFNCLLPQLKEVIDIIFELEKLRKVVSDGIEAQEDFREYSEVLEKIFGTNASRVLSQKFNVQDEIKAINNVINKKQRLIEKQNAEIGKLEALISQYIEVYGKICHDIFKNNNELITTKEIQIKYIREYFFCIVYFKYDIVPGMIFNYEAIEYIIQYLRDNEEEKIAEKKIAIILEEERINPNEFFELFKETK